ncbi:unnamed protein product [Dovyalis caffra]|uniref:EF-hand domain-containing protein n=1 Tax=Dovyalis caffra TaxID=77055 RepID=A0AAV1QR28_9ROSI|nr:unnamed protein product [Dovyalis caffra]
MERPLIGEISGGGDGGVRRRDQSKPRFNRRYDAITYGSRFQKAAALVDLAEDGIGIPEEILDHANFESAAKFYFIFVRSAAKEVVNPEANVYSAITLIILVAHIFFPISYEGFRIYWKNPLNWLKFDVRIRIELHDICYVDYYFVEDIHLCKAASLLNACRNLRDLQSSILILAGMLKTYVNVLMLLNAIFPSYALALGLLFLLFSSWLAYVIFEDTQQGKMIFTSYGTTLYQMLVLFTTSNNPDVWIPAYKASRWYSLFFVLYVLIGVYFVTNLVLAVVYDSFKDQLVKQVSDMDRMRKRVLMKAFNLIDKDKAGYLNKEQCIHLFVALNKYRSLPKISKEDFELIFDELDDTHDFKINSDEFEDLCNAIALRFQKEDVPSYFEYLPIYHSPFSETLREFIRSPKFGYIISFVLIVNLITVIIETTLDIENNSAQKVWQDLEFVFGWIYVVEMALKIYAYGFENYWREGQNRFDFVITLVIVIGETVTFASPHGLTFLSNGEWIRYLLIARMLRLIRILMYVQSYRAFVTTFLTLIPSLMPYLGTIFCVMCIYCSLGIQIFGGLVSAGNPNLEGTDLAEEDYGKLASVDAEHSRSDGFSCVNNGIDRLDLSPACICHTLISCTVLFQSYKDLTGTYWSLTYFISFYLITVLLLLNLVVAFVLEAFFAEMELEASEKCEENKEGSNTKSRRRSVGLSKPNRTCWFNQVTLEPVNAPVCVLSKSGFALLNRTYKKKTQGREREMRSMKGEVELNIPAQKAWEMYRDNEIISKINPEMLALAEYIDIVPNHVFANLILRYQPTTLIYQSFTVFHALVSSYVKEPMQKIEKVEIGRSVTNSVVGGRLRDMYDPFRVTFSLVPVQGKRKEEEKCIAEWKAAMIY